MARGYNQVSFVPEALPIAPRPMARELLSSWLLRTAAANGLTLAQLTYAIEARDPKLSLHGERLDEQLSPEARSAIAQFTRLPELHIQALELSQQLPNLPEQWILRPVRRGLSDMSRMVTSRARYGFCPLCLLDMSHTRGHVWIVADWACAILTHCPRHRMRLLEICPVCFIDDPIALTGTLTLATQCRRCNSSLTLHNEATPLTGTAERIIALEMAILAALRDEQPDVHWAGLHSAGEFIAKLLDLIESLIEGGTGARFLIVADEDGSWDEYLLGRQTPEARLSAFSWKRRFVLMGTVAKLLEPQSKSTI